MQTDDGYVCVCVLRSINEFVDSVEDGSIYVSLLGLMYGHKQQTYTYWIIQHKFTVSLQHARQRVNTNTADRIRYKQ